jgi:GNAT superfamily N-acetyltransferase
MRLRPARAGDEEEVLRIDSRARAGDLDRTAFLQAAIAKGGCLVAETDDVVGYAVTTPQRFFSRDFIDLLFVQEDSRRRGVGRALLRAAIDHAGTTRVFSSTNESNTPMRSLFSAEGWTMSGRLQSLDEGDPALVYFIDRDSA